MSKNFDNNATEGEKFGKIFEDKNPQESPMNVSSNAINIDNVKEMVSSNNINENTPDYDYNIISNINFYNI